MTTCKKYVYTAAFSVFGLFLAGCASNSRAPIEALGPTSAEGTTQTFGLGSSASLNSQDITALQSQIYNAGQYSKDEQQAMLRALAVMPCKAVYFAFDSDKLTADGRQCLDQAAQYLKQYHQPVRLAGNTDPRGSEKYNFNLGQRRADAARVYLLKQQVPANLICAVSYGKLRPSAAPSQFYSQLCGTKLTTQCKQKAIEKAYYLDRRTELNFGQVCG
ncbi:MAG: OmpA family protein [Francisellaceae bacterium]